MHRIPNFIRSPRELLSKSRREGFVGQKVMNRASTSVCKRNQNAYQRLDSDPMSGYFKNTAGNRVFVRMRPEIGIESPLIGLTCMELTLFRSTQRYPCNPHHDSNVVSIVHAAPPVFLGCSTGHDGSLTFLFVFGVVIRSFLSSKRYPDALPDVR